MRSWSFKPARTRDVIAEFNGGTITSDGGVLLLKEVEAKRKIIKQFAACFTDHRDPDKIEHWVEDLVAQRVYGLALGYEDLNAKTCSGAIHCWQRLWARAILMERIVVGSAIAAARFPVKSALNRLELHSDDPQKDGR